MRIFTNQSVNWSITQSIISQCFLTVCLCIEEGLTWTGTVWIIGINQLFSLIKYLVSSQNQQPPSPQWHKYDTVTCPSFHGSLKTKRVEEQKRSIWRQRENVRRDGTECTVTIATKSPLPITIKAPCFSFTVRSRQVPTPTGTVTKATRQMQQQRS